MSDFDRTRKDEFVQEYAYVEDYSLFYDSKQRRKEIDLDNGKAIEVI